jgi:hypothetical protein
VPSSIAFEKGHSVVGVGATFHYSRRTLSTTMGRQRIEGATMTKRSTRRVLIVSEDADWMHRATRELKEEGIETSGCLGPAHSHCFLEDHRPCPLAAHVEVAIVDSPPEGSFTCHLKDVGAGDYAESLQRAHPDCRVILCGAPEGAAGATGEILLAPTKRSAIDLVLASLPD